MAIKVVGLVLPHNIAMIINLLLMAAVGHYRVLEHLKILKIASHGFDSQLTAVFYICVGAVIMWVLAQISVWRLRGQINSASDS